MLFANWIRGPVLPRRIEAMAVEVAQRCQTDVAARLLPTANEMTLPEMRGYIRARCAAVLDQEMLNVAEHLGLNPILELAVRGGAANEIVRMTLGDLLKNARPQMGHKAA